MIGTSLLLAFFLWVVVKDDMGRGGAAHPGGTATLVTLLVAGAGFALEAAVIWLLRMFH